MSEVINKPLYVRIQEYLAEQILSGKLKPDDKLQSEREFSDELGVSRMTIRKAMTELVNEGLLERRHGSGTYVAKPKITFDSQEMFNYIQSMQVSNISTASQLLELEEIIASRRLATHLAIEIGAPIIRVQILRFANRVPVILERIFFPCDLFPNLSEWDLEKSSIHSLLAAVYQVRPGRVSQTVEAVQASDQVAKQLRVEENFPLLMLSRVIFNQDTQRPVIFSQDFLRSDYVRIHTKIDLSEGSRSA